MANEIKIAYSPNKSLYVLIYNAVGLVWNNTALAFQTYASATYAQYALGLTPIGTALTSRFYEASFPVQIPQGTYDLVAFQQQGGSPAESDPPVGSEDGFGWNGAARLSYADLATSGLLSIINPVKVYRGEMVQNFPFKLVSALDHVTPFVSGVVSGQINRDGGLFGPLQSGAFTELGLGWYAVTLTSGDTNGGTIALVFTANGVSGGTADQRDFAYILQRASGYA